MINAETVNVYQRTIGNFDLETSSGFLQSATESDSNLPQLSPEILESVIGTLELEILSVQDGNDHGSHNSAKSLAATSHVLSDPLTVEEKVAQSE